MSNNLAQRTIKNSLYGFISYLWPIAFTIFVTPFVIHKLGIANYGLYVLMLIIAGFFSLLNFGLVYALVRHLAGLREQGTAEEKEHLSKLYGATIFIFFLIGILAILVAILLAHFGLDWFNINVAQRATVEVLFYFVGAIAFFNSMGMVFSHIPYALQRQDIGTNIYIANITVLNLLIIGALSAGFGLIALVVLQAFSALLALLANFYYSRRLMPDLCANYSFDKKIFKEMFSFGGYVYLHNISSSFLSQIDRIIISSFLGPAAVTFYSVPNSVAEKTQGVIVSLTGVLFPVTAELAKEGDRERIRRVYHRAMQMIALLASALTMTIIVLAKKVLLIWVGPEIDSTSTRLLYWLTPTYFLLALFLPTTHFLTGIGRAKFLAFSSLAMAILNILLLFVLLPVYGITGAAAAYLFSLAPLFYIFYHIEKYFLDETYVFRLYGKLFLKLIVTAIPFYIFGSLLVLPMVNNLLALLLAGGFLSIVYVGLYKIFGFFSPEEWTLFKGFLKSMFLRLKFLKA